MFIDALYVLCDVHVWCSYMYMCGARTCTCVVLVHVRVWCSYMYMCGARTCVVLVHVWCSYMYMLHLSCVCYFLYQVEREGAERDLTVYTGGNEGV